jgi:16S rRNA (cytosine967-C5)-methyltransferase
MNDQRLDARYWAANSIAISAESFPNLLPQFADVSQIDDPRERQLATAIQRTVLQRWITLEYILNRHLKKPLIKLEPKMQGILLTGAAQLLFFERLPDFAVVSSMVNLAAEMIRPEAKGMVNAVLRNISKMIAGRSSDEQWQVCRDKLPVDQGTVTFNIPLLPDPNRDWTGYWSIVTSHPASLLEHWGSEIGKDAAVEIAIHDLTVPPTIISSATPLDETKLPITKHTAEGHYYLWQGNYGALTDFLSSNTDARVQDPTASKPIAATADLKLQSIIDYCAGKGTKSVQLATLHPNAKVYATDPDAPRFAALKTVSEGYENLIPKKKSVLPRDADLILLDVPCSNTGVLARRPEARYRFNRPNRRELVNLQKQIALEAIDRIVLGGYILYSTCSICEMENQQVAQLICEKAEGKLIKEHLTLPKGAGSSYQDGGYFALIQC